MLARQIPIPHERLVSPSLQATQPWNTFLPGSWAQLTDIRFPMEGKTHGISPPYPFHVCVASQAMQERPLDMTRLCGSGGTC
eukprot:scaffold70389_cov31-Tisochrysis_lutea.AAC.2